MKNTIYLFLFFVLNTLLSCSGKKSTPSQNIVTKDSAHSSSITLQTDSGKMVITSLPGDIDSRAVLYSDSGKVKASGYYVDSKPSGAWVTYDNEGNVVKADHYSEGRVIYHLDKNDFTFHQWNNQKLGVRFDLPANWKEISSPNPALLVSFEKESDDSGKIKPNFNVVRAQLQLGDNLQKMADAQLQLLHDAMSHVAIVNEHLTKLDSCDAFIRYGTYDDETGESGFLNAIVIRGNDAWLFSCVAPNNSGSEFLKYQGVFQHIVESFKRLN